MNLHSFKNIGAPHYHKVLEQQQRILSSTSNLDIRNLNPFFSKSKKEPLQIEFFLVLGLWDLKKDCSCGRKTALAEFWFDLENQFKITTTTCSSSSGWNNVYTTNPNYRFKMKRRTFLFIRICPSSMLKKRNIKFYQEMNN